MKFVTPEISWHGREPVYSVDFQYKDDVVCRMASCGTDRLVRMWDVQTGADGKGTAKFLSTLNRHTRTVNCVRFSPDGHFLASAGDDAAILLWKLNTTAPPVNNLFGEDEEENQETWNVVKTLRSHLEDVYDLSWSSDNRHLISGSVDNTGILWDIKKGNKLWIFTEHKSFVQGVAFDPLSQYLATMSSDRSLRVFNFKSRCCVHNIKKTILRSTSSEGEKPKSTVMFHDDSLKSFFRRLSFSPDGQLLVVPAGCLEKEEGLTQCGTSYVFTRASIPRPVLHLPSQKSASLVVRFCPLLYTLRETPVSQQNGVVSDSDATENIQNTSESNNHANYETIFKLPYRMVFAIASEESVIIYDTQQRSPIAYLSNIHYHQLSDLTWSRDGRFLVVASTDGYCTIISFEEEELGQLYKDQIKVKAEELSESEVKVIENDFKKNIELNKSCDKKPVPEAKSEARRIQVEPLSMSAGVTSGVKSDESTTVPRRVPLQPANPVTNITCSPSTSSNACSPSTPKVKTPRRIQPMTLSSPSAKPSEESSKPKTPQSDSKKPRRIGLTTLTTYDSRQNVINDEEENSLHLVLETSCDGSSSTLPAAENKNSPVKSAPVTSHSTPTSSRSSKERVTPLNPLVPTPHRTPTSQAKAANSQSVSPRRVGTVLLASPRQPKTSAD